MRDLPTSLAALVIASLPVAACSLSHADSQVASSDAVAAPCLTRGATYLITLSDMSGDCGPAPSEIFNVASGGQIGSNDPVIRCERSEVTGCEVRHSGCTWQKNGCSAEATYSVTYTPDGATGTGLESLDVVCANGQRCAGTYGVLVTRQ